MNKNKKFKIISFILLVLIISTFSGFFYFRHLIINKEIIKCDGRWYTKKSWHDNFGNYDLGSKNTHEEVYTTFKQALLDNDVEKVLQLMREERKSGYGSLLKRYQNELGSLKSLGERYPNEIHKINSYNNFSSYKYKFIGVDNQVIDSNIEFVRNSDGYWQIDAI